MGETRNPTCLLLCNPDKFLSPHQIIRTRKVTQSDTLIEITLKKVLGVPVPIYHFKQPSRLSEAELPFHLILVSDVDDKEGLHEIPVDFSNSSDSWFLTYHWTPVVCVSCDRYQHVGWKFTRNGDFFYALIVAVEDSSSNSISIGALGEVAAEALHIGTQAPKWMVDALTGIVGSSA